MSTIAAADRKYEKLNILLDFTKHNEATTCSVMINYEVLAASKTNFKVV